MNTDAEPHLTVAWQGLVMCLYRFLDCERTGEPIGDARELGEH
jgi:hypothetical protein